MVQSIMQRSGKNKHAPVKNILPREHDVSACENIELSLGCLEAIEPHCQVLGHPVNVLAQPTRSKTLERFGKYFGISFVVTNKRS